MKNVSEIDKNGFFLRNVNLETENEPENWVPFPPPANIPESCAAQWVGRWTVVQPSKMPGVLFLHVDISGGDGMNPIGISNNGTDTFQVTAALRNGIEAGSNIVPYSGEWRIIIRDSQGGIYDQVKVVMTDGILDFLYGTTNPAGVCSMNAADLTEIFEIGNMQYSLRLAKDVEFKVYRDFT